MNDKRLFEPEPPLVSPEDRAWVEKYLGLEPGKLSDDALALLIEQGI